MLEASYVSQNRQRGFRGTGSRVGEFAGPDPAADHERGFSLSGAPSRQNERRFSATQNRSGEGFGWTKSFGRPVGPRMLNTLSQSVQWIIGKFRRLVNGPT